MVMRMMGLLLGVVLGALLLPDASIAGEGPRGFEDRPQVGQPVRFTDAAGHVFRPERLVVLTQEGASAARIPATTSHARSEEHLDLSGLPLIGHVFRDRLAPGDAKHSGEFAGPLTRVGDTLVLDARGAPVTVEPREVVLTANFPRDGAVSYRLGWLELVAATAPRITERPAGTAWLIGDTLVLAGAGYEPAIEDLERAVGDVFR